MGGGHWCIVPGCKNNSKMKNSDGSSYTMFSVPTENERQLLWLRSIKREDLMNNSANKRVCSIHFETKMFLNDLKNRLHKTAVPVPALHREYKPPAVAAIDPLTFVPSSSPHGMQDVSLPSTSISELNNRRVQTRGIISVKSPCEINLRLKVKQEPTLSREEEIVQLKMLCHKYLPKLILPILDTQIDLINRSKPGFRYYDEVKQIALHFYFLGPQCYNVLQKIRILPSKSTLQRIASKWCLLPGCSDKVFDTIQIKMQQFRTEARDAVLLVDELSLKSHLFYNIKSDEIIGFHQTNGTKTSAPAKFALVLMACGIRSNWKQLIGYIFVSSSCSFEELQGIVIRSIVKLKDVGCFIRAITTSMGSNFIKFTNQYGISKTKPYFKLGEDKIYYIFDVPHLTIATRNSLFKNKFAWEDRKTDKKFIQEFYDYDKCLPQRIAHRLTDSHLNPSNFEKIRVKLAAQILSATVAGGLTTYMSLGRLSPAANGTIEFIDNMDKLFDILNSSTFNCSKKHNQPFQGADYQINFLHEMLTYFSNVRVINCQNKDITDSVKMINCWQITIRSVISLWEFLDQPILFTRRLNQDPLQNFFGAIKQQSGNCLKPTPIQFQRTLKKLFVSNYFTPSEEANRIDDLDKFLLELDRTEALRKINLTGFGPIEKFYEIIVSDNDYRNLDLNRTKPFLYLCGYLLHKCLTKHNCNICTSYSFSQTDLNNEYLYIHYKADENTKYGKHKVPQEAFYDYINKLENLFINNFDEASLVRVGTFFNTEMLKIEFIHPCLNFPFQYLVNLFIRFRIYSSLKFLNKEMRVVNDKS